MEFMHRLSRFLKRHPALPAAIGLFGVAVVGAVDFFTGAEIAFSIFYLIPVGFTTWYVGRRAGIFIAMLSAATWLWAELEWGVHFSSHWIPFWNALMRMGIFLIVASLLSALKRANSDLEANVMARTVALTREVEERTAAERRILEQHEEQKIIMDAVPALIFYKDGENRMIRVNRTFADTLGMPRGQIEGKYCRELWPETAEDYWRDDMEVMESGIPKRNIIETMRTPGGVLWLQTDKIPCRDRDGGIVGIIGFSLDITRRRQAEEQLRHAQKMDAIGTLAGGLAHDFNNILAGIMGYAYLLKEEVGPASPSFVDIAAIEKLGKRGADLTRSLLSFARRNEYAPKPVAVNRIIGDVFDIIRQTSGRAITFTADTPQDVSHVLGDEGQLQQLFMNLCINACDAMPGGGTLTIRSANVAPGDRYFSLHPAMKKGAYVSVSVTDTGLGITPEVQQRIYEPFFTTKSGKGGTGLGLAVVSGIVGLHGGSIELESTPGRGSTFTILIPATAQKEEEIAQEEVGAPRGTETVLLVDDEEDIREGIGRWLKSLGYTVITAGSGEEALEAFDGSRGRVDLVLLDLVMKGIGGEETFRRMRVLSRDIPIILCTGYAPGEAAQRLIASGANGLANKPLDYTRLAARIREILAERRA